MTAERKEFNFLSVEGVCHRTFNRIIHRETALSPGEESADEHQRFVVVLTKFPQKLGEDSTVCKTSMGVLII